MTCNFWCECGKLICVNWMRFWGKEPTTCINNVDVRKSLSLHSHSLSTLHTTQSFFIAVAFQPSTHMYIYGVWITYKIEIAVYNITDYFAMLWQRQQPTDQPPMHEYYTMSTTTEYLEWENIKKIIINFSLLLLFFSLCNFKSSHERDNFDGKFNIQSN